MAEAVGGTARARGDRRGLDMLSGSLWRAIPAFALPVALTGILEQMSSLIDTMMVGHLSGEAGPAAMAAVGSNTPITSLLLNLFIGIALGTNVVIANAIGSSAPSTRPCTAPSPSPWWASPSPWWASSSPSPCSTC